MKIFQLIVRIGFVFGALIGSFRLTFLFLGNDPDSGFFFLPVFAIIGTLAMLSAIVLGAWVTGAAASGRNRIRSMLIVVITLVIIATVLTT
jgi:hypothetical protein